MILDYFAYNVVMNDEQYMGRFLVMISYIEKKRRKKKNSFQVTSKKMVPFHVLY